MGRLGHRLAQVDLEMDTLYDLGFIGYHSSLSRWRLGSRPNSAKLECSLAC